MRSTAYAKPRVFADLFPERGRSARTTKRLQYCFIELLASIPFAQITAADIAARCDVSRSTVYRKWAGLGDLLWSVAGPIARDFLDQALAGSSERAVTTLGKFWTTPGLLPALLDQSVSSLILSNISTSAASEIERRSGRRDATTAGLAIAGALMTFLQSHASEQPGDSMANELAFIIYTAGLMTPQSIRSTMRDRMNDTGVFPPAVSIRQSLASDDYIVSMIDGRPYRSLRRHLARFGMSVEDYRRCFNLPDDYPMVARSYSETRRSLARAQFRRSEAPRHGASARESI